MFKDQGMYYDKISPAPYRQLGATSYGQPFHKPGLDGDVEEDNFEQTGFDPNDREEDFLGQTEANFNDRADDEEDYEFNQRADDEDYGEVEPEANIVEQPPEQPAYEKTTSTATSVRIYG